MLRILVAFLILILSASTYAVTIDEQLTKSVEIFEKLSGKKVKGVSRTPTPGLFVFMTSEGGYLSSYDGTVLITGKGVVWKKGVKNKLPQEDYQALRTEAISELNKDDLIIIKYGTGARTILLYSAVDCSGCIQQENLHALAEDHNATYYIFPNSLDSGNWPIVTAIMCNDDRASAWSNYMRNRMVPKNNGNCEWSKNFSKIGNQIFAERIIGESSTPAMVAEDGTFARRAYDQQGRYIPIITDVTLSFKDSVFNPANNTTDYFSSQVAKEEKSALSIFGSLLKK